MVKHLLHWICYITAAAALVLTVGLGYYFWSCPSPALEALALFLDAYKALAVAFFLAGLTVLAPHVLSETRDGFERRKESRRAYSQAKTAVIYLPESLAALKFADGVTSIQSAHEKLHLAETYPSELRAHLAWHPRRETWTDRIYWELVSMQRTLRANAKAWDKLQRQARLDLIVGSLHVVEQIFGGPYNDKWVVKPLERKRQLEDAIEAALQRHFDQGSLSKRVSADGA